MTVQYQGVWSLQSAAQLQSTQRWVTDPLFDYNTLLLQADDAANGAQNNTFLDSSSNAFAITRNGNTTQGSFTPFSLQPGAWSTFFPGASSLIVPAGSAFAYGTGAFTVEAWINPYTYQAGTFAGSQILAQTTTGQNYFTVSIGGSGEFGFTFGSGGGTTILTTLGSIPLGRWTHVAVVREGTGASQLKLYVNGFLLQSGTCSFDFTNTTYNPTVGNYTHDSAQNPFGGYISNLRVVKGVAVYTGNFAPSPLSLTATQSAGVNTAAITGTQTSLLTAQSNRFLDNSVANAGGGWTVTLGGTPSVQAFSPFAPQFQWTPSVIGGSGYFDGTGDWINVADSTAFTLGSGNFTVEFWVYSTTAGVRQFFAGQVNSAGANTATSFSIEKTSGNKLLGAIYSGVTQYPATSSGDIPLNAWTHIALVRDGNTLRQYINGVQDGTADVTGVTANDSSNQLSIGRLGELTSNNYFGYVSNFRFVNGTAVYTGAFTPPIAPVTTSGPASSYSSTTNVNTTFTSTNTSLLTNFTNAGIVDGTMKNNLETVGNAQVSTAVVKYGSGSMFFDGTGDWLELITSPSFSFGTGDFTIEAWFNATTFRALASGGNGIFTAIGSVGLYVGTDAIRVTNSGVAVISDITVPLTANIWYHIALTRIGSSMRVFLNGVQVGSTITNSTNFNNTGRVRVGTETTETFNGYIDDLRITKGIARYTQNFIPPSVALPRQ